MRGGATLTVLVISNVKYRIYSNKHPGRLFNFGTLTVGAYLRVGAYFFDIFCK